MSIPRGVEPVDNDWFDWHNIQTGKAFVEDGTTEGERIFIDYERSLVFYRD